MYKGFDQTPQFAAGSGLCKPQKIQGKNKKKYASTKPQIS